jgi:L-lactate utilization protein LutC
VKDELIAAFVQEANAIGAHVHRVSKGELADCLFRLLEDDRSVVAAAGLDGLVTELRSRGVRIVSDGAGATAEAAANALPEADAGLCRALAGVAASGTVLIGPGWGLEGLISVLPPHCVVLLACDVIHPDVAAALSEAAPLVAAPGSRLVFVTGPSRTSDIELTPVVGVHGPLRLDVVIVND